MLVGYDTDHSCGIWIISRNQNKEIKNNFSSNCLLLSDEPDNFVKVKVDDNVQSVTV